MEAPIRARPRVIPKISEIAPTEKRSRWLITVNTNKMGVNPTHNEQLQNDLYNAIYYSFFENDDEVIQSLDFREKVSDVGNDVWYPGKARSYPVGIWRKTNEKFPELIDKIEVPGITEEGEDTGAIGIEVGPVKGRVHAHFELDITHHSNIHLNSKALGQLIQSKLTDPSITNLYVNFQLMRSVSDELNVKKYRQKSMTRRENVLARRRDFKKRQIML